MFRRAVRAVDRARPPKPGVALLIYHRIGGGSDSGVDLDADVFERQMCYLHDQGSVVTLDRAVQAFAAGDHSFDAKVVLTFDDGTSDFAEVAAPIMERYALPATLYLATSFVDEQTPFPWGAAPISWAGLTDTCSTGQVTVGSHTHAHHLLDRVGLAHAIADLDKSIELIGSHTGRAPAHFAYPKAIAPTLCVHNAVAKRFKSAALARSRINAVDQTDPYSLWRTPIQRSDTFDDFVAKTRGGLRWEGEARAMVGRAKYRNAVR